MALIIQKIRVPDVHWSRLEELQSAAAPCVEPRPSDMRPSSSRTPIRYSRPSVAPSRPITAQPRRESDSPPVIVPIVISDPDPIKYNPPAASDSGFNSGGGDAGGGGATDTF